MKLKINHKNAEKHTDMEAKLHIIKQRMCQQEDLWEMNKYLETN